MNFRNSKLLSVSEIKNSHERLLCSECLCPPPHHQNSYVENLMTEVIVLGSRAFGR